MTSNRSPFIQRLIRSRYLIVVNVLVIIFLGLSLSREVIRSRAIDAEIADLQARADSLTVDTQAMLELQTAMQTESFIEREARLKLGLKKPGETVVVLRDEQDQTLSAEEDSTDPLHYVIDPTTGESGQSEADIGNPTKWWYYFFDKSRFNELVAYE